MRKVLTVLKWIVNGALIAFLVVGLYSLVMKFSGKEAVPRVFGISNAVVISGSMEPVLMVNDLVFYREADRYEVGDVIIFQDGEDFITHRVYDVMPDSYITKGDANSVIDPKPVDQSHVYGKMIFKIPNAGFYISALKSPWGIALFAVLILLILFLPNVINHIKKQRKARH